MDFIIAPTIWFIFSDGGNSCTDYGYFLIFVPIMGFLLLVCYAWGRYYANKLAYARTVKEFLEDDGTTS